MSTHRYPERATEDAHLKDSNRSDFTADPYYYSTYRQQQQQQQQQQQHQQHQQEENRFRPGTLERKNTVAAEGMGSSSLLDSVDSYEPPPPPPHIVTEQPGGGGKSLVAHCHPFERTYPQTLESLAERVHPFYGLQGPGSMGPVTTPSSGGGILPQHHQQQHQQHQGQSATLGRSSTLGRVRGGTCGGAALSLMSRPGGRLMRSGSDQRLPLVDTGTSEFYEYVMSGQQQQQQQQQQGPNRQQHQQQQPNALNFNYPALTGMPSNRSQSSSGSVALTHRRRVSIDYASDTEASTRGYASNARRARPGYAVEGSTWKPPPPLLGLGMTPTTPMTPTTAFTSSSSSGQQPLIDSRSNSLPRGGSAGIAAVARYRREVHFERDNVTGRSVVSDSQEDSDGAVSAPELPISQKQKQQQQQLQQLQQQQSALQKLSQQPGGLFHGMGRMPNAPGQAIFTAAEYKAWMQRAPSTSAIYERLRQGREAIEAHRVAKLTYSAENLVEKTKQVFFPFYFI